MFNLISPSLFFSCVATVFFVAACAMPPSQPGKASTHGLGVSSPYNCFISVFNNKYEAKNPSKNQASKDALNSCRAMESNISFCSSSKIKCVQ